MCIRAALCVKPHEPKRQKDPIPCEKGRSGGGNSLGKGRRAGRFWDAKNSRRVQGTAGKYRGQQGSTGSGRLRGWAAARVSLRGSGRAECWEEITSILNYSPSTYCVCLELGTQQGPGVIDNTSANK